MKTETDALLFTQSPEGKNAYRNYLQEIAASMLSGTREGQTLRVFDIPANMIDRWEEFTYLRNKGCYFPKGDLESDGILSHEQILKPDPASLQSFVRSFAPEGIYMPRRAYDYASLTLAGSNAMESFQYSEKRRFSYDEQFKTINRNISRCADLHQKATLYRERGKIANDIIGRNFPEYKNSQLPKEKIIPEYPKRQSRGRGL